MIRPSTPHTEHCAGTEALQRAASAKTCLGQALSFSALCTVTFYQPCSLNPKGKVFQLHLTQITVPGQQACSELAPYGWKLVFAPQSSGSSFSFTTCKEPSDCCALHVPSQLYVSSWTLLLTMTKDLDIPLAQK